MTLFRDLWISVFTRWMNFKDSSNNKLSGNS